MVYNTDRDALADALREAVEQLDPSTHFEPTVRGFEDHVHSRGLHLEAGALRTGVIDAYGRQPENLLSELEPVLRRQLTQTPCGRSPLAVVWFSLGVIALIAPLAAMVLTRPGLMTALQTLFGRLVGG